MATEHSLKVKLQIYCGGEIAMGPGKADLLEAIARHGSISAAAKAMGMSYRRAWLLVDAMNRCWSGALVEAHAGGHERGARVTQLGTDVLARYRAIQTAAESGVYAAFDSGLATLLAPAPNPSQR